MPWVRIDEDFAEHPKLAKAGPLAMALQVAALCYCNRHLTDGFIPWSVARTLVAWEFLGHEELRGPKHYRIAVTSGRDEAPAEVSADFVIGLLLEVGIWDQVEGGYAIHDYSEYQPTRDVVLEERAQKQRAGRLGGMASGQARAQAKLKQPLEQKASTRSSTIEAKSKPVPVPDPDPDPGSGEDPLSPPAEPTTDTSTPKDAQEPDLNSRSESQRRIFAHWNSQGVIEHRKLTDRMRRAMNGRLKDYSETEICRSIDNYARVIRSPDQFFFTYRWTLEDFLHRGFEQFKDWDIICANFSHKPRSRDAPMTNTQRALEVARKFAAMEGEGVP